MAKKAAPLKYTYVAYRVGNTISHEEVIERSQVNAVVGETLSFLMEENPRSVVMPQSRPASDEEVQRLRS